MSAVDQPPDQIGKEKTEVHLTCSPNDNTLLLVFWYQQRQFSSSMTLIGYKYGQSSPDYEGQFEEEFQLTREETGKGALIIRKAKLSHAATYFCAASAQ